ncbi:hypothetical protein BD414DRAFT_455537 [Trametes punicea]|nr:hypothetical protein BD414DRAFT_455537 [Trametes punicea]
MSFSKVFGGPADGSDLLAYRVQEETQVQVVSRKRSADPLESLSLTPRQKRARTEAVERECRRYEKLMADELCRVKSGQLVQCARCGSDIKLSDKNNYDSQHWLKHRRLCVKRPDHVVEALRAKSSLGPHKTSSTPELTTDTASEMTGTSVGVKSEPADSPAPTPPPEPTSQFEMRRRSQSRSPTARNLCAEYMAMAHPDARLSQLAYPDVLGEMRAWTPARVKPPACMATVYINPEKLRLTRSAQWPVPKSDVDASSQSEDDSDEEEAVQPGRAAEADPYTQPRYGEVRVPQGRPF